MINLHASAGNQNVFLNSKTTSLNEGQCLHMHNAQSALALNVIKLGFQMIQWRVSLEAHPGHRTRPRPCATMWLVSFVAGLGCLCLGSSDYETLQ